MYYSLYNIVLSHRRTEIPPEIPLAVLLVFFSSFTALSIARVFTFSQQNPWLSHSLLYIYKSKSKEEKRRRCNNIYSQA